MLKRRPQWRRRLLLLLDLLLLELKLELLLLLLELLELELNLLELLGLLDLHRLLRCHVVGGSSRSTYSIAAVSTSWRR